MDTVETDAEMLIEELLAARPTAGVLTAVLGKPKYRNAEVGAGLARRAAVLQGMDDERCADLAGAAVAALATRSLSETRLADSERVRALAGNALRRLGRAELARDALTLFNAVPPGESAEYHRALALVHWERARLPEATALLAWAERLFRAEDLPGEAMSTRRLRVLLHAEQGQEGEALRLFSTTGPEGLEDQPWLSARAALTAAFCFVSVPAPESRAAARAAMDVGRELASRVDEEAESLHLDWLAARAEARWTGSRKAEAALSRLRKPALGLWPWCDVILLNLDLLACRVRDGGSLDMTEVLNGLRRAAPSKKDLEHAGLALALAGVQAAGLGPWDAAGVAGRQMRYMFRQFSQSGPRPLPFLVPWPGMAGQAVPGEAR